MKKLFNINILAVICLVITSSVFAQQAKEISVPGLKDKVNVRRDERGVPYIQAQNEGDLYFVQGYITAQDRLWQMDILRRTVSGETAELFGKLALDRDRYWRKYGFVEVAEQSVKELEPELRNALEAYAKGVNAYISSLDQKNLPPECQILNYRPRDWTAADSIVIGKVLADGLNSTWRLDLMRQSFSDLPPEKFSRLFPLSAPNDVLLIGKDIPGKRNSAALKPSQSEQFQKPIIADTEIAKIEDVRRESLEAVGLYAEELAASNNWVVSGKKTTDGKPILANDPHLQATAPGIWYLVNLSTPTMRVAGVTFPGAVGVVLGHNQHIAWGATNVGPDVQDLYLETFDPNDKTKYKTPDGWATATVKKEQISVRQNPLDPKSQKVEELEVVKTRNGVIFAVEQGKSYALNWTAFDPKNSELSAFFYLNRAKNWSEFKNALRPYGGPMQNFIFADTAGNIGWYAAGRIPIRREGTGELPYDGSTNKGDWIGYVPFDELPHLYNPPSGMIVTANQRIVGTSYKHQQLVRAYASPHRARRIYDLLKDRKNLTVNDMESIQYDMRNELLLTFAKSIVKSGGASPETIKLFSDWDGSMKADSRAAMLASEMLDVMAAKSLNHSLGSERAKALQFRSWPLAEWLIANEPKEWLPKEFSNYAELYRSSEKQAKENLVKRFGADESKWVWGSSAPLRFFHPLAAAPLIGAQFDVKALPRIGSGLSPNVGVNVSMRMIATPGNWDTTLHTIPLGQSGVPSSKHWKDQLDGWYSGKTPVFPFSQKAIEAAAKETVVLKP